ncbi:MAG: ribbon-helix-helix protein, CopG family [Thermoproteota archaeon]
MSKRKLRFWKIPVTPLLDELLEKAISIDTHVSKSDFIREAVREKLAKMGLMEISERMFKHSGEGDSSS